MRRILIIVAALTVLGGSGNALAAEKRTAIEEHCEYPYYGFLLCVSAGLRWVTIGTSGDDRLIGTEFADIIRSRHGRDIVDGGWGEDVCYVQPADTVRRCEHEV